MFLYFSKYVNLILNNARVKGFLFKIWNEHFTEIINITQYPEARTSVYVLVKRSMERIALELEEEDSKVNSVFN